MSDTSKPSWAAAEAPRSTAVVRDNVPDDPSYVPLVLNGVELPHVAAANLRALPKAAYDKWLADRHACLSDQLVLSRVMGLDLVENPHRAMFRFFGSVVPGTPFSQLSKIKKKMLLWSRGSAKTFAVRVQEVYMILNYPRIRICFLTGGEGLGKRQLTQVKKTFQNPTAEFLRLFPEFCLKSVKDKKGIWTDEAPSFGNAHEFNVPARGDSIFPEPTFCISTARAVKAGAHFELIFIDDLVNDSNWQSVPLLEKCYQDYLDICPLLDPSGMMCVTGTRYALNDCYDRIKQNAEEMMKAGRDSVWAFSIHTCWSTDCTCTHSQVFHDHDGTSSHCAIAGCTCAAFVSDGVKKCLFPRITKANGEPFGHTIEFLNAVLAELGKAYFACQYLNSPELAGGFRTFTQALIDACTIDLTTLPPRNASMTYLCGDMAYSLNEDCDETVIYAFIKSGGRHIIWGCWFGKFIASDRADLVLRTLARVRPETMYIQKDPNSDSFMLNLTARAQLPEFGLAKVPITWVETNHHTKDFKNQQIAALQLPMQGKRLFFAVTETNGIKDFQGTPGAYAKLCQQLLKFPSAEGHDDHMDCVAQVAAATSTGYLMESLPVEKSQQNWLRQFNIPREPEYGPDHNNGESFCY